MSRITHIKPTQADVDRIAKAAAATGMVLRGEFISNDGSRIVVTAGKAGASFLDGSNLNPWDEVLIDAADHKRPS